MKVKGNVLFILSRVLPNIVHSMKEWAYTFDAVSKEQWIRQIESDLKQKTIASLQSEWWPGEPLMPLLHRDDVTEETVSLPISLFTQPPLIAEWISTSGQQATAINQQILDALRQDTHLLIPVSYTHLDVYKRQGVHWALKAAKEFEGRITILDLRSLVPLDEHLIYTTVREHGRCLVVTEDTVSNSFAQTIAARIQEQCWTSLDAPVRTIGSTDMPAVPLNEVLEKEMILSVGKVIETMRALLDY